jgi:hypothetical protein
MALSPQAIQEVDSILEGISRKIWNLPITFPKAGLHALLEDIGLNIPSIWEDYCGATIRSWTQILNDEGTLCTIARAPFNAHRTNSDIGHWKWLFTPARAGRTPLCPSIVARNMATLLMADLHPVGGPEIWFGNQISTSIATRIPIELDEDGCPCENKSFPQATHLLGRLAPLRECGIHNWSQVLCRGPDGHPYS